MSIRRLVATAATMALIAGALSALTPDLSSMADALASAQRTADTAGPEALVVSTAGLLAWAVWGWGALGLALTAASALPGLFGGTARLALHVVLPAGARRSAALALGLGLGIAGPLLGTGALLTPMPAAADTWTPSITRTALDWPMAPTAGSFPAPSAPDRQDGTAPDWPVAPPAANPHVVVRGECLWHIASARLTAQSGRTPTDGEVTAATHAWWQANTEVIGPDPDRLLPGQVLTPPDPH